MSKSGVRRTLLAAAPLLAQAEEQLEAPDRLCLFSCKEYDELIQAVAAYRRNRVGK